tara:strand:- start:22226 stop:22948 length:723 start_codon:yes stop_codon:yes gene_type:complete
LIKILITLCARGGSKGIPRKNITDINGKPLIAYSIELAKSILTQHHIDIALSTEDQEIRDIAKKWGLETSYNRPKELSFDRTGKVQTILDLLRHEENQQNILYDFILDLDISSPLRTKQDVEKAFDIIYLDVDALSLFSVNPSQRNPYFNMVEQNKEGYYDLVKKPPHNFLSRQSSPLVYDLNASFYWYRRSFFEKGLTSPITAKSLIYKMDHICFDLDHEDDLLYLKFLIKEQRLSGIL